MIHNFGVWASPDGVYQYALINDPDVSTLLAQDKGNASIQGVIGDVHSVKIGANHYIALGPTTARARLLLNTGAVNLED